MKMYPTGRPHRYRSGMTQASITPGAGPAPATRPIRFVHRGAITAVDGLPATTSVLAWLREQAGRTGTKEEIGRASCRERV